MAFALLMENKAVSAEEKNPESKSRIIKMITWLESMNAVKLHLRLMHLSSALASNNRA
jgi:hypothetical protein